MHSTFQPSMPSASTSIFVAQPPNGVYIRISNSGMPFRIARACSARAPHRGGPTSVSPAFGRENIPLVRLLMKHGVRIDEDLGRSIAEVLHLLG